MYEFFTDFNKMKIKLIKLLAGNENMQITPP